VTVKDLISLLGDLDQGMEVLIDDMAGDGLVAPVLTLLDHASGDEARCLLLGTPWADAQMNASLGRLLVKKT
jgi:hypothetical protein